jgi:potassium voltage-gated channel Eag-related subfamily H protein 7
MTVMMIFGSFVWAWVIGSLCGILATLDPQATAFRNTMDELNHFMAESNFPTAHKVRVRDFFRQRKDFDRFVAYETLLSKMSSQLKGDSALLLSIATIEPVWYLQDDRCEKEFLAVRPHAHIHHATA